MNLDWFSTFCGGFADWQVPRILLLSAKGRDMWGTLGLRRGYLAGMFRYFEDFLSDKKLRDDKSRRQNIHFALSYIIGLFSFLFAFFSKFLFLFCSTQEGSGRLLTYYFFLRCFQLEFSQNLNGHILSINRFYAYLTISITKAAFDSNLKPIRMDSHWEKSKSKLWPFTVSRTILCFI